MNLNDTKKLIAPGDLLIVRESPWGQLEVSRVLYIIAITSDKTKFWFYTLFKNPEVNREKACKLHCSEFDYSYDPFGFEFEIISP